FFFFFFFFSSRRRHTRFSRDWSSDVCSSDLVAWLARLGALPALPHLRPVGDPREVVPVRRGRGGYDGAAELRLGRGAHVFDIGRSEERRVGKACKPQ